MTQQLALCTCPSPVMPSAFAPTAVVIATVTSRLHRGLSLGGGMRMHTSRGLTR
jgi:hypothetical protein